MTSDFTGIRDSHHLLTATLQLERDYELICNVRSYCHLRTVRLYCLWSYEIHYVRNELTEG